MNMFGSFPGFQVQWGNMSPSTSYGNRPGMFASSNPGFNTVSRQIAPPAQDFPTQAAATPAQPQLNYEQILMSLLGGGGMMGGGVPYASGGRPYGSALAGGGMQTSPEQDRARSQYRAGGMGGGFNPTASRTRSFRPKNFGSVR